MKKVIVAILAAVMSMGLAKGQTEEKKEYFVALDSVMRVALVNPDAALEMCRHIEGRWGLSSDIMYCRGVCHVYKNDYGVAAQMFSSGAALWKKDDCYRIGAYYKAMATIQIETGDYEGALKSASQGIKQDKKFHILYYQRGQCLMAMEEYKKAIADFRKACGDKELFCDAKAGIALCYANMGKTAEGKKALEESLQLDTYHGESRRLRALFALAQTDFEGFIDDYMIYMQVNKPTEPAYIFDICKEPKNYEHAKHYAQEILEGQSDSLSIAYWEWVMCMIEINIGKEVEMWKHAQRAREMNPGNTMLDTKIWYQYAAHYSVADDMESLLTSLDTLIARDARTIDGNYALLTAKGRVLTRQKKFGEAVASYKEALKMDIQDSLDRKMLYYRVADLYQNELNDADIAIAYYDSVLTMDPSMTSIMYQIGKIYTRMKRDTAKANEVYSAIVERERNVELNSFMVSQFALAAMGRYAEAEAMQQRLDEYAKSAEEKSGMAYNAACLYSIIGKTEIAVERLMEAMDAGELSCQQMKDDEDFDNIRETDEYKAVEKMICLAEE